MSDRKLASVRRIVAIDPIEGADKIICVTVDGWKLVSNKENGFNVGDLVIYFEIDSFLPVIPQFEWMRDRCYKNTENLGEGFLVRTIKLRGQVSQGLIVPLSDFFKKDESGLYYYDVPQDIGDVSDTRFYLEEGMDVTEFIGVKKYEKPIPAELAGVSKGTFPSFIHKTAQERIQNCLGSVKNWIYNDKPFIEFVSERGMDVIDDNGRPVIQYIQQEQGWLRKSLVPNSEQVIAERDNFEVTVKLDGTSMTVYYNNGQIGVCSRNHDLIRSADNTYWNVAAYSGILGALATVGRNLAFQGELMGPGIQGNREKLTECKFYVFDVFDIDQQKYLEPWRRQELFKVFAEENLDLTYIEHVPIVHPNVQIKDTNPVELFLTIAEKVKSIGVDVAEGIVFKSNVLGGPSFKVINNKFLLKEQD